MVVKPPGKPWCFSIEETWKTRKNPWENPWENQRCPIVTPKNSFFPSSTLSLMKRISLTCNKTATASQLWPFRVLSQRSSSTLWQSVSPIHFSTYNSASNMCRISKLCTLFHDVSPIPHGSWIWTSLQLLAESFSQLGGTQAKQFCLRCQVLKSYQRVTSSVCVYTDACKHTYVTQKNVYTHTYI